MSCPAQLFIQVAPLEYLQCRDKLCYLATPYSNYSHGRDTAYLLAAKAVAALTSRGITALSPICNYHMADGYLISDGSFAEYRKHCFRMLHACRVLILLDVGNESMRSAGMRAEYEEFRKLLRPVILWRPETGTFVDLPAVWNFPQEAPATP
jgi:hypothetical protein